MKILITGGGGDIATATANLLRGYKHEVLAPTKAELDVTIPEVVSAYMAKNEPDALINCAGYINPVGVASSSMEDFTRHFEVNVFGAVRCTIEAVKHGCYKIINIGSTSALESKSGWGAYCASKAALAAVTETAAKEGLMCYGLHPSKTKTKMRQRLFPNEEWGALATPERIAEFVVRILQGEFANGTQIIVYKDHHYAIPPRVCPR